MSLDVEVPDRPLTKNDLGIIERLRALDCPQKVITDATEELRWHKPTDDDRWFVAGRRRCSRSTDSEVVAVLQELAGDGCWVVPARQGQPTESGANTL